MFRRAGRLCRLNLHSTPSNSQQLPADGPVERSQAKPSRPTLGLVPAKLLSSGSRRIRHAPRSYVENIGHLLMSCHC
ncbi:hypothetical protein BDN71DRAFT_1207034 [Pleurotus eryngii]|uniref:Uncharacterized protein n=1 Tax=Pleurotus eryngii TaxID=5323 RepID=A0A9P6DED1_PLEER|nr:hypothetical protein BDN71DRAFT_1207034 [Pleurotus eryngii]